MAVRVIPGVNVQVIREIVPPLPMPSGILAIVGIAEKSPGRLVHVDSFPSFKEIYGQTTAFTIPEARQAFLNGIFEVVVSPVTGAKEASLTLNDKTGDPIIILEARGAGPWANKIQVNITNKTDTVDMTITYLDRTEEFKNLDLGTTPGNRNYLFDVINRQSDLVVAKDPNQSLPNAASNSRFTHPNADKKSSCRLVGTNAQEMAELIAKDKSVGTIENPLKVDVISDSGGETVTLKIKGMGKIEVYEHVNMDPKSDRYLVFTIQDTPSSLVTAIDLPKDPDAPKLPVSVQDVLKDGKLPDEAAYQNAIDRLEKDPTIDMVLASTANTDETDLIKKVFSSVKAHCQVASESANNRLGIGGIPVSINSNVSEIVSWASVFNSERFVLVAPDGVAGAIAGLIGGLNFFQSPTYKTLSGVTGLPVDYSNSDLRQLLIGNALPVDFLEGRGFIIVKGIDTTGGQISVTRIADRAVRRIKAISDQFIGTLNTEDGRNALRQRIVEFFMQLERDGAIVPSTDGKDPAFLVDVYSSQADFAQGIVRVDIAIRPVRAIDFIYATILVKI